MVRPSRRSVVFALGAAFASDISFPFCNASIGLRLAACLELIALSHPVWRCFERVLKPCAAFCVAMVAHELRKVTGRCGILRCPPAPRTHEHNVEAALTIVAS